MIIRPDKKTPLPKVEKIHGLPLVDSYCYLGVDMDDCANFRVQ